MSISAYTMDHPTTTHLQHRKEGLAELGPISMYCLVTPDTVSLDFVGPHYEPRLRLKGQVSAMEATEADQQKAALYGIDTVDFNSGEKYDGRPRMVCDYEFSREQIKEMIDKGLYEREFAPPKELFTSEEWMIPADVEFYVSQPEHEDEPAVLLCEIKNLRNTQMTLSNSGYDLVEYFPNLLAEQDYNQDLERDVEHAGRLAGKDMFAEYSFGDEEQGLTPAQRREKEEAEHAHERAHKQLPYLAGEKKLEFTEEFEQAFPTDDYIPDEVLQAQQGLENLIAERENDAVLDRFEDIRKNESRDYAQSRMGFADDVEDELEGEDLSDLFAEDEPEDGHSTNVETAQAEKVESNPESQTVELNSESEERDDHVESTQADGDMFAGEDYGDSEEEGLVEIEQLDEGEERAQRARRRQLKQSRRAVEMSMRESTDSQPEHTEQFNEQKPPRESVAEYKSKARDKDLGPELG